MNKKYRCIFFDLDHTLWDYETNSACTLEEMYHQFNMHTYGHFNLEDFKQAFAQINRRLWHLYDTGKINSTQIRQTRFTLILRKLGVRNQRLAHQLSAYYLAECPRKNALIPGATETLQYLHGRYPLTVVTNGFNEVQLTKLHCAGLIPFFSHVVTSEQAGSKKPSPEIFRFALQKNVAAAHEAVMIGDNPLTDIAGARAANIDALLFNPDKLTGNTMAVPEIQHLAELRALL
jgi:putative hydrolase of the HAD superfamily